MKISDIRNNAFAVPISSPAYAKAAHFFYWRISRDAVPCEENQILPNGTHASTHLVVVMNAVFQEASS
jgi:hypothetical protein